MVPFRIDSDSKRIILINLAFTINLHNKFFFKWSPHLQNFTTGKPLNILHPTLTLANSSKLPLFQNNTITL